MSYGIKVSKPGCSVWSDDPADLVLNSQWGTIKFLKWGAGTITVNASSTATATVSYSWSGGIPLVLVFAELTPDSGRWYVCPFGPISGDDTYFTTSTDNSYVQNTSFTLELTNNTAAQKTVDYYYFIIGETGTPS